MRKLISMTDYVLERSDKSILQYTISETFKNGAKITNEIFEYAKFLKIPLTISMFIPCDKTGNILKEPKRNDFGIRIQGQYQFEYALKEYQQAKERCLFSGLDLCEDGFLRLSDGYILSSIRGFKDENIEDLVYYSPTLTQTALKTLE